MAPSKTPIDDNAHVVKACPTIELHEVWSKCPVVYGLFKRAKARQLTKCFFSLQETIHFGRGSRPSQEMFQLLARLQCAIHLGIFTKLPSGIVVENGSEGQVSYWNVNGQWLLSAGSACSRIHPSSAQSMRFCCLKPMFDLSEAPTVCTRDMLVPERILVHGRFTPDQGSWQMWGYRGVPSPFSGFKENQGHFWGPIPKVDEPPMSFFALFG